MQRQQALLERIGITHRMFMAQRSSWQLLTAKEAAIKRLRDGVNHYREVKATHRTSRLRVRVCLLLTPSLGVCFSVCLCVQ